MLSVESHRNRVLVINIGSMTTKLAYQENGRFLAEEHIVHSSAELGGSTASDAQYQLRMKTVTDFIDRHGVPLRDLDCITSRGGQTEPVACGTWRINEKMVEQNRSGRYGRHANNLGPQIALELCAKTDHAIPLTTDMTCTDELDPIARYSGLREVVRRPVVQALNIRAAARRYAKERGKKLADLRLVVAMLGGGISVVAMRDGRMVDAPDGQDGEGSFMNNRCGAVDLRPIIDMCYSGAYTHDEMLCKINGQGGLMSYLGTANVQEVMDRVECGDALAREVVDAMCYQTAKDVGAMATVLDCELDAILVTGGMAHIPYIVESISRRCKRLAPIVVMAGEWEMEALAEAANEALEGIRPIQEFAPREGEGRLGTQDGGRG